MPEPTKPELTHEQREKLEAEFEEAISKAGDVAERLGMTKTDLAVKMKHDLFKFDEA